MNIVLKQVMFEEKETLRNLLEKYDYEFSQYDHRDVDSLGLFGYFYLDHYWMNQIVGPILLWLMRNWLDL